MHVSVCTRQSTIYSLNGRVCSKPVCRSKKMTLKNTSPSRYLSLVRFTLFIHLVHSLHSLQLHLTLTLGQMDELKKRLQFFSSEDYELAHTRHLLSTFSGISWLVTHFIGNLVASVQLMLPRGALHWGTAANTLKAQRAAMCTVPALLKLAMSFSADSVNAPQVVWLRLAEFHCCCVFCRCLMPLSAFCYVLLSMCCTCVLCCSCMMECV